MPLKFFSKKTSRKKKKKCSITLFSRKSRQKIELSKTLKESEGLTCSSLPKRLFKNSIPKVLLIL